MGYVAASLVLLVASEAIFLQCLKPLTLSRSLTLNISILITGCFICLNVINGIRNARLKRFAEHKVAMTWACMWTGSPGGLRIAVYVFLAIGDCRLPNVKGIAALD